MSKPAMQPNEISEVPNRPISQELLARDVTRLGYVARDGTPRTISDRVRLDPHLLAVTYQGLIDAVLDHFNDPSTGRDDAPDDGNASGLRAVGPSCGSIDNRRTRDVDQPAPNIARKGD